MKILIADNNGGNGDWAGLYIDGLLFQQGHSLDLWAVLSAVKDRRAPIEALACASLTDAEMEAHGGELPQLEKDLWMPLPLAPPIASSECDAP